MKRTLGGMAAHSEHRQRPLPDRLFQGRDRRDRRVCVCTPGMELDVREHAFPDRHALTELLVLLRIKGLTNLLHGGSGMYMDRFITQNYPGPALAARVRQTYSRRRLQPGEKMLIEPGGFLYKDSTVAMNTMQMDIKTGVDCAAACTWQR